jgi:hypothetical protein
VATAIKTYGYRTKRSLPAMDGKPKVCNRCELWFLAGPRERACDGCATNTERTARALRRRAESDSKALESATLTALPLVLVGLENVLVSAPVGCPWTRPYRRQRYPGLAYAHSRAVREGRQGCICWKVT